MLLWQLLLRLVALGYVLELARKLEVVRVLELAGDHVRHGNTVKDAVVVLDEVDRYLVVELETLDKAWLRRDLAMTLEVINNKFAVPIAFVFPVAPAFNHLLINLVEHLKRKQIGQIQDALII